MKTEYKILSSQRYIDQDIVNKKKIKLLKENASFVIIPCSKVGKLSGWNDDYAIIVDKHHLAEAAKQLGLELRFEISDDSEKLTGEELLQARYIDAPYYDFQTGVDEF